MFTSAMASSALPARASTPTVLRAMFGLPCALPTPLTVMPRTGALAAGPTLLTTVCGVHAVPSTVAESAVARTKAIFEQLELFRIGIGHEWYGSPKVSRRRTPKQLVSAFSLRAHYRRGHAPAQLVHSSSSVKAGKTVAHERDVPSFPGFFVGFL